MVLNLLGLSLISVSLLQLDLNTIAESLQSRRSAKPKDDGWIDTAPREEAEWIDT